MEATLRLTVRKDLHVTAPEFLTRARRGGRAARRPPLRDRRGRARPVTAARDAVRRMIDWLGREHGLAPIDAYLLCSVAVDLRISEIVDMPNVIVTAHCPLSIFD